MKGGGRGRRSKKRSPGNYTDFFSLVLLSQCGGGAANILSPTNRYKLQIYLPTIFAVSTNSRLKCFLGVEITKMKIIVFN